MTAQGLWEHETAGARLCGNKALWEQGLPAIQASRSMTDRIAFIAGKPCSHSVIPRSALLHSLSYRVFSREGLLQIATEELLEPFALRVAQYVFRRAFFFHQPLMQE